MKRAGLLIALAVTVAQAAEPDGFVLYVQELGTPCTPDPAYSPVPMVSWGLPASGAVPWCDQDPASPDPPTCPESWTRHPIPCWPCPPAEEATCPGPEGQACPGLDDHGMPSVPIHRYVEPVPGQLLRVWIAATNEAGEGPPSTTAVETCPGPWMLCDSAGCVPQ